MRVLSRDPLALVKLPTAQEARRYQAAIEEKYSIIKEVYAASDGPKLQLKQSGDAVVQEIFYNGRTHDHYVGNVFVFAPSGVIIPCAVNAPGNMHDSCIAEWGAVYDSMQAMYKSTGGRVVVDSAFSRGNYPFLIKSAQDEQGAKAHTI